MNVFYFRIHFNIRVTVHVFKNVAALWKPFPLLHCKRSSGMHKRSHGSPKRSSGRQKRSSRKTVNAAPKNETGMYVTSVTFNIRTYNSGTTRATDRNGKFPTVLVRWEGNNSKQYDNTKEEILVSNIVAINKTAVIEPSLDQISVGGHIEYEFVAKKGEVQPMALLYSKMHNFQLHS